MMKSLYELISHDNIISKGKLKKALKEQKRTGALLGIILLSRGYITKETLKKYISYDDGSNY